MPSIQFLREHFGTLAKRLEDLADRPPASATAALADEMVCIDDFAARLLEAFDAGALAALPSLPPLIGWYRDDKPHPYIPTMPNLDRAPKNFIEGFCARVVTKDLDGVTWPGWNPAPEMIEAARRKDEKTVVELQQTQTKQCLRAMADAARRVADAMTETPQHILPPVASEMPRRLELLEAWLGVGSVLERQKTRGKYPWKGLVEHTVHTIRDVRSLKLFASRMQADQALQREVLELLCRIERIILDKYWFIRLAEGEGPEVLGDIGKVEIARDVYADLQKRFGPELKAMAPRVEAYVAARHGYAHEYQHAPKVEGPARESNEANGSTISRAPIDRADTEIIQAIYESKFKRLLIQSEIADASGVRPRGLGKRLKRLITAGYVERVGKGKSGGYRLTPAGAEIAQAICAPSAHKVPT